MRELEGESPRRASPGSGSWLVHQGDLLGVLAFVGLPAAVTAASAGRGTRRSAGARCPPGSLRCHGARRRVAGRCAALARRTHAGRPGVRGRRAAAGGLSWPSPARRRTGARLARLRGHWRVQAFAAYAPALPWALHRGAAGFGGGLGHDARPCGRRSPSLATRPLPRLARWRRRALRGAARLALGFLEALARALQFFLGDAHALLGDVRRRRARSKAASRGDRFAASLLHLWACEAIRTGVSHKAYAACHRAQLSTEFVHNYVDRGTRGKAKG